MKVVKTTDEQPEEAAPQEVQVTAKVPRILVELFVYGVESDKAVIKQTLDELQRQMGKARRNMHKVRILWYVDKGEMSVEQKIEWFKENGRCKYFIPMDGTKEVPKEFIANVLKRIRNFETAFGLLKSHGIRIFGKREDPAEA